MRILVMALLLVLVCSVAAQAQWAGSQTLRLEPRESAGLAMVYTSVLQYSLSSDRVFMLIIQRDPEYGTDGELSFTQYFTPWGDALLYATFAIRRGIWESELGWLPNLSLTYRF